jgi:hypothetical protein
MTEWGRGGELELELDPDGEEATPLLTSNSCPAAVAATTKSSRASMAGAVGSRASVADEVESGLELSDGFEVAASQMTRRQVAA